MGKVFQGLKMWEPELMLTIMPAPPMRPAIFSLRIFDPEHPTRRLEPRESHSYPDPFWH